MNRNVLFLSVLLFASLGQAAMADGDQVADAARHFAKEAPHAASSGAALHTADSSGGSDAAASKVPTSKNEGVLPNSTIFPPSES